MNAMKLSARRLLHNSRALGDIHTFGHKFNTKWAKDPAIERWVYQRYFGQFGQFKVSAWSLKWLTIIYGVVPAYLFYVNQWGEEWLDQFRAEGSEVNQLKFGRFQVPDEE